MLPSIPVSPLIQQSLSCASLLADITQKLSQQQSNTDTTTSSSSSSSSTLEQDAEAQRTRLDQLTQQMYAVRDVFFHQWGPDELAKQIVIVDSQLFCHHGATQLNDFHTYLLHSLAHQLIIANSYAAFDNAVRLAHCLSQYRDWNGLMAVVRCLALPAVQRLSTSSASPLCHDFPWVHHDDSTTTTTNDTSFAAYRQALRRSLLPLRPYRFDPQDRRWSDSIKKINHTANSNSQDTSDKDMDPFTLTSANQHKKRQQPNNQQRILVAIPWLPPLLEAETEHDRDLLLTLCRYNRWPAQIDVARSLLLPTSSSSSSTSSSPSSPSSTPSSSTTPPAAVSSTTMLYSTTSSSLSSISPLRRNNNLPPIILPHAIVDLLSLGAGDLVVQHWLVSRAYLTLDQLLLSSQLQESDQDARATSPPPALPSITLPSAHQLVQLSVPPSPASSSASSASASSTEALRTADAPLPPPETLQQDYDDGQDWRNQTIPYNDDDEDDDEMEDVQVNHDDPWQHSNNRHSLHFIGTSDQLVVALSPPSPPPLKDHTMEMPSISVASSIPLSVTATTMPISQLGTSTMYDGDGDDVVCDDDDENDDTHEEPISDKDDNGKAATMDVNTTLHDTKETLDTESLQFKHDMEAHDEADDDTVSNVSSLSPLTAPAASEPPMQQQDDTGNSCDDQQAMDDVEIVVATSTTPDPAASIIHGSTAAEPVSVVTSTPQFDYDEGRLADQEEETDSEQWTGYPVPGGGNNDDDDDEIWTGYPEPMNTTSSAEDNDDHDRHDDVEDAGSPHRSTPSETSEDEWKGYHATSEEAKWQAETILKVQQQEWQGYTLETLDEDELDSSTMMNGEFVKSCHARELVNNNNTSV